VAARLRGGRLTNAGHAANTGEGGDAARTILPDAVKKSHDRLCTVSRTIEAGTPVSTRIE